MKTCLIFYQSNTSSLSPSRNNYPTKTLHFASVNYLFGEMLFMNTWDLADFENCYFEYHWASTQTTNLQPQTLKAQPIQIISEMDIFKVSISHDRYRYLSLRHYTKPRCSWSLLYYKKISVPSNVSMTLWAWSSSDYKDYWYMLEFSML